MANNVFHKALFRTPKYNVFPQENEVKLSYEIGKLIPVQYWDLGPGDSIKSRLNQLTRMATLLAPVFQRFKIDFHAIAIPHRLAIPVPVGTYAGYYDGFSSFHNLAVSDSERPVMPQLTYQDYVDKICNAGYNFRLHGSLLDYLGYPTFSHVYRDLLKTRNIGQAVSFGVDPMTLLTTQDSISCPKIIEIDSTNDFGEAGYTVYTGSILFWLSVAGRHGTISGSDVNFTPDVAGALAYINLFSDSYEGHDRRD